MPNFKFCDSVPFRGALGGCHAVLRLVAPCTQNSLSQKVVTAITRSALPLFGALSPPATNYFFLVTASFFGRAEHYFCTAANYFF